MFDLCEFQIIDPDNNIPLPWFTHESLEEIKSWDLKEKKVLEWGSGLSTLWWAIKCKEVISIEANAEWFNKINNLINYEYKLKNTKIYLRNVNEGDQTKIDFYTDVPKHYKPNIVVVDGILRYECILKALEFPRPLILIVDNWQQDYIFRCPAAELALQEFKCEIYKQPDHTNHEGNGWQTGIWLIK